MHVTLESANQPAVIQLIAELDAYQDMLYPPESRHSLDLTSLCQPNVLFAVVRDTGGQAIGCGAVVLGMSYGELKRMYVHPSSRGRGVAKAILVLLESEAGQRACSTIMLETGPSSSDALAFYETSGYRRRALFGGYADDPLSVFMEKHIAG